MKTLVFDTGPIINLALNNLLWVLKPLKERFGGEFLLATETKKELVDKPYTTKKYKFESYQILELFREGILTEVKDDGKIAHEILDISNTVYSIDGQPLTIIHHADAHGLALASVQETKCFVVDERTMRLLVENPVRLGEFLEHRLQQKLVMDRSKVKLIQEMCKGVTLLRSVELGTMAFEMGLLDHYVTNTQFGKQGLLEGLLWALKLNGCAVSEKEIGQIMKLERA